MPHRLPSRNTRFLVQVCMGHTWGGPHMYLLRIAEEAARRGFESVIATNARSELEYQGLKAGFEVLALKDEERQAFWPKLMALQSKGSISSVHLHSIRGLPRGFISLPSHIQMVLTEHSYRFREVLHPLSRMALSRVDVVLAISEAVSEINGRALGINPERMRTLHHGVDLHRFHPEKRRQDRRKTRRRFGLHERDLVLLVPTTFKREKNLSRMVEVLARLRERFDQLQLVMTGDCSRERASVEYRRYINEKINSFGLSGRVHFTGFLDRIEDAYAASDVVCVPTIHEAFGLPAVEAMGSGLPVVGSNQGAFPEIVEHGVSGACIDVEDVDEWERVLGQLLDDRRLREKMGENGRERAEMNFSLVNHWQQLFGIYEEGRRHQSFASGA